MFIQYSNEYLIYIQQDFNFVDARTLDQSTIELALYKYILNFMYNILYEYTFGLTFIYTYWGVCHHPVLGLKAYTVAVHCTISHISDFHGP